MYGQDWSKIREKFICSQILKYAIKLLHNSWDILYIEHNLQNRNVLMHSMTDIFIQFAKELDTWL